jgi:hypothetical protein
MWLNECLYDHKECQSNRETKFPKRVLDVGTSDEHEIRLIESENLTGEWVVLSHCWGQGDAQPVITTTRNLELHLKCIQLAVLPATFRDAVIITRRLGFRYLWIDSLCIIQDSNDDWSTESSKMHDIYRNAVLTIAAEASLNSRAGIFESTKKSRSNIKVHPFSVKAVCHGNKSSVRIYFRDPFPENCHRDYGPLSQRAWVLQEELLSARTLRFAPHQMYWQCETLQCSEGGRTGQSVGSRWRVGARLATMRKLVNLPPTEFCTPQDWHKHYRLPRWHAWRDVINEYMNRRITYDTDRLPVISALAYQFAENLQNLEYRAGLWEEDFHAGLLWETLHPGCVKASGYVAPSWSWASLNTDAIRHRVRVYDICVMTRKSSSFQVKDFSIRNAGDTIYGIVRQDSFVEIAATCANLCSCRVPLGCFDVFTDAASNSHISHQRFSNVAALTDTTCSHDPALTHTDLLLVHIADGTGYGFEESWVDFPFFAWCLLLQRRERGEKSLESFERVGLIKLPYFGRDFKGVWKIQALRLY